MNRFLLSLIAVCLLALDTPTQAQTTITLDALQDARISRKPADLSVANTNYGNYQGLNAYAWSTNGELVYYRGLIEFDLTSIPAGAIINNATFSFYHDPISPQGPHESLTGPNECYLQRIITSWDENIVTWNTQPSVTTTNQVYIPQSTSATQDYPNINVTQLVQDMIDNPLNGYGFLFRLINETNYRRMIFASSNHPDTTLHPILTVTYTQTTSISDYNTENINITVHPNPVTDQDIINIQLDNNSALLTINVFDAYGKMVEKMNSVEKTIKLSAKNFSPGIYLIRISSEKKIICNKKIIVY